MGYETALELLADPTRRVLVDRMRSGPVAVGLLADGLTISRPAVSKHLKAMLDGGLVSVSRDGTRRLYGLNLEGLAELRTYVEGFWDDVLARYAEAAEMKEKG